MLIALDTATGLKKPGLPGKNHEAIASASSTTDERVGGWGGDIASTVR